MNNRRFRSVAWVFVAVVPLEDRVADRLSFGERPSQESARRGVQNNQDAARTESDMF